MFGFSVGGALPGRVRGAGPSPPRVDSEANGKLKPGSAGRAPGEGTGSPRRRPALRAGAGPGPAQHSVWGPRRPGGGDPRSEGRQRWGLRSRVRSREQGRASGRLSWGSEARRPGRLPGGTTSRELTTGTPAAGGGWGPGAPRPAPGPGAARPRPAPASPDVRAGGSQDILLHRDLLPVEDQVRVAEAGLLPERAQRAQQARGVLRVGHGAALGHRGTRSSARPWGLWKSPRRTPRAACARRAPSPLGPRAPRPLGPALGEARSSPSLRNALAPSALRAAGAFKEPRRCVISPRRPRALLSLSVPPSVAGGGQSEASFPSRMPRARNWRCLGAGRRLRAISAALGGCARAPALQG